MRLLPPSSKFDTQDETCGGEEDADYSFQQDALQTTNRRGGGEGGRKAGVRGGYYRVKPPSSPAPGLPRLAGTLTNDYTPGPPAPQGTAGPHDEHKPTILYYVQP